MFLTTLKLLWDSDDFLVYICYLVFDGSNYMGNLAAFARIKIQVLTMTSHIPVGRVSTYRSLGEHIDVMPRHVAYILTMLSMEEKDQIPWYRVVSDSGAISAPKTAKAIEQIENLATEGIQIDRAKKIADFDRVFIAAIDLDSGIDRQSRTEL
jgi:methylated-DNA-protein-cysteine methyltransferase related protein